MHRRKGSMRCEWILENQEQCEGTALAYSPFCQYHTGPPPLKDPNNKFKFKDKLTDSQKKMINGLVKPKKYVKDPPYKDPKPRKVKPVQLEPDKVMTDEEWYKSPYYERAKGFGDNSYNKREVEEKLRREGK